MASTAVCTWLSGFLWCLLCRRCGLRSLIEATKVRLVAAAQKVTHCHQHTRTLVRYSRQISSACIANTCGHDFALERSLKANFKAALLLYGLPLT